MALLLPSRTLARATGYGEPRPGGSGPTGFVTPVLHDEEFLVILNKPAGLMGERL
jgi:hypothetical protein